ncbi:hypothetical protein BU23DRAFT_565442 [Bimuria novae-zelandiae CBS 107.79]|uniref:RING-type domain-containing protein n=1 Tax=Bimuria novae-zelandiae CBS 107.79 TaxID=1447943 RepID=A0A6A5VJA6_9PLEO|nr:hypothetical protein BU23DRAFT_565442 [Bimuria novae-zelandiae CBS 107.79]
MHRFRQRFQKAGPSPTSRVASPSREYGPQAALTGHAGLADDINRCPICMEDYGSAGADVAEDAVTLPCGHLIGRFCLLKCALQVQRRCPLCREDILVMREQEIPVLDFQYSHPSSINLAEPNYENVSVRFRRTAEDLHGVPAIGPRHVVDAVAVAAARALARGTSDMDIYRRARWAVLVAGEMNVTWGPEHNAEVRELWRL